jgi:DNA mismatch endonuclease (patch repair protein)
MTDVFTRVQRSKVMASVRSRGNRTTEGKLATLFRSNGIKGWRRHASLPGKPDFVFRRERVVIFVDGCFWHGCSLHGEIPRANNEYWIRKLARNKIRDREANRLLRAAGWRVLRIWGHSLNAPKNVLARVISALSAARSQATMYPANGKKFR